MAALPFDLASVETRTTLRRALTTSREDAATSVIESEKALMEAEDAMVQATVKGTLHQRHHDEVEARTISQRYACRALLAADLRLQDFEAQCLEAVKSLQVPALPEHV